MANQDEIAKYQELREIVARLRAPDGCPWDKEQTHASLRPYVIEEAYEVLAVLDEGDLTRLPDELGDLLFQVLIHAQVAEDEGEFAMADVLSALATKLVRRHPHVFGDVQLETADEVVAQWDALKRAERDDAAEPALAGIPKALPALSLAQALLRRAATAGFAWPDRRDVLTKITEELDELANASSKDETVEEFGDLLLNLANYAQYLGIDAEESLRQAANKFRRRFDAVESAVTGASRPMTEMAREELMALWEQAKASERSSPP
jgi:tetrapyrrole methylase family protein/MazG family protein